LHCDGIFPKILSHQSIFIHDPQIMLYACMFLAHKVEECYELNAMEDMFCKKVGKDPKSLELAYHE